MNEKVREFTGEEGSGWVGEGKRGLSEASERGRLFTFLLRGDISDNLQLQLRKRECESFGEMISFYRVK